MRSDDLAIEGVPKQARTGLLQDDARRDIDRLKATIKAGGSK